MIEPEGIQAHLCLGKALAEQGKFEPAIAHYQKAVEKGRTISARSMSWPGYWLRVRKMTFAKGTRQ